jgi:hypothetical protein
MNRGFTECLNTKFRFKIDFFFSLFQIRRFENHALNQMNNKVLFVLA